MRWLFTFFCSVSFSLLLCFTCLNVKADTITFETPKGRFSGPWLGGDHSISVTDDYVLLFGSQSVVSSTGFSYRYFYGVFHKSSDFRFVTFNGRKATFEYRSGSSYTMPGLSHFSNGGHTNGIIYFSDDSLGGKGRSMRYKDGDITRTTSFTSSLWFHELDNYRITYHIKLYSDGHGFSENDINELEVFTEEGKGFDDYSLDYDRLLELGLNTPRKSSSSFDFIGDFSGSIRKLIYDSDGLRDRLNELSRVFSQFDVRKPLFSYDTGPNSYEIGVTNPLGRMAHFLSGWGTVSTKMIWDFQRWVLGAIQALYFYRKIQSLGTSLGSVYQGSASIMRG